MAGSHTNFALVLGVALLRVAYSTDNQSEATYPDEQPIAPDDAAAGRRPVDTPEVVLQLKYDRGELNRIYLAQFRKKTTSWVPSVPVHNELCSDLCHAGLGGDSCGSACQDLIPVGLQSALLKSNETEIVYGEPRSSVCPTLCANNLGDPLCNCAESEEVKAVDWSEICGAFCLSDKYVLGGCPTCEDTTSTQTSSMLLRSSMARALSTTEGWIAWCNVQCRQGQGGAACNCDKAPFQ